MDQSKKTMRHFYCRDVLWETFEQMANDFDCSIDYLINEAMRFYARSKNYNAGAAPPSSPSMPQQPASAGQNGPMGYARPAAVTTQAMPAEMIGDMVLAEVVLHGWDLARASGQRVQGANAGTLGRNREIPPGIK